jgi:hypothetical protein
MNEAKCREKVEERSGGDCEVRIPGVCQGRGTNMQHRRAQGQQGPWTPSNVIHVCGMGNAFGCHGHIHQHPNEATAEGWTVKSWDHWDTTPVKLWHGYVLLDEDGGWTNLGHEHPVVEHAVLCGFWASKPCDCGGVA